MSLLRHEMGHVLNHTYLLEKEKRWQKLFGPPSLEYSESFRARPYSKRFVRHLGGWYAQSHPEEDFAETVAIWLTPDLDWRQQYKAWKALEKLEYVDAIMGKLAGRPPLVFSKTKMSEASRLRSRLALYYKRRRRTYAQEFPDFFDADLKKLFVNSSASPNTERASTFLRRSTKPILNAVSAWTGEPKFTLHRLLRALSGPLLRIGFAASIGRCRRRNRRLSGHPRVPLSSNGQVQRFLIMVRAKKRYKVLVLFDTAGTPPPDQDFSKELKTDDWAAEAHVIGALKKLGHEVRTIGVWDEPGMIIDEIKTNSPDVVFNLTEHFNEVSAYDRNVAGLLEMMDVPYTGSSPTGLTSMQK